MVRRGAFWRNDRISLTRNEPFLPTANMAKGTMKITENRPLAIGIFGRLIFATEAQRLQSKEIGTAKDGKRHLTADGR